MFTGIIECIGKVVDVEKQDKNVVLSVESAISTELKIDQSVAHNGICLTVVEVGNNQHKVCAVQETVDKTNLGNWIIREAINLERCMPLNGRLDGHIVQGHVDDIATCIRRKNLENNWLFTFQINEKHKTLIVEKGSICINGISLTCFNVTNNTFEVTIIPYTFEHTTMKHIQENNKVNIEFDIIGKYVNRMALGGI